MILKKGMQVVLVSGKVVVVVCRESLGSWIGYDPKELRMQVPIKVGSDNVDEEATRKLNRKPPSKPKKKTKELGL